MRYRVNFQNEPLFKMRFKRPSKIWTIDQVHELWEKACGRSYLRRIEKSKFLKKIVDEIPKGDKDRHITYYTIPDREEIFTFEIKYDPEWKSYVTYRGTLRFSKDKVVARNEKIQFLINSENKAFEMGQQYYELGKMESSIDSIVREIMWDMVQNKLRKYFIESDRNPDKVFLIDIASKKYYVESDGDNRYPKFKLMGQHSPNDIIKI
jgi:hypothetical protein